VRRRPRRARRVGQGRGLPGRLRGRAIGPLLYLGAKHMVTGYDHLLFLVGVIFFLYRLQGRRAVRQPASRSATA
jgi:hypothetical protein